MENKCLRMAFNVPYVTSNKFLYDETNLPTIKDFIIKNAKNFYKKVDGHNNPLLSLLGAYSSNPLPFRLSQKLPKAAAIFISL